MNTANYLDVEAGLTDFNPTVRAAALAALQQEQLAPPAPAEAVANMHCHTFFSYNAYGHSPTSLAWLARRRGYPLLGIVDFDVLDGVDEFLDACELLGVRGSAGIETRIYLPEFATREINSPGEPGIYYHMGVGFTRSTPPPAAAPILADLQARSNRRNRGLIERVNAYLDPVAIDYEADVLPLTPAGNATERHIVAAYISAAERTFADPSAFWAERLELPAAAMPALLADLPKLQNTIRAKLMKKGGAGYVQPGADDFPRLAEYHRMIIACGALPCATWLDGLSAGEQAMPELLNLLIGQGAAALNIVPDRNWNITDPAAKAVKLQKLYEVVELAQALDLPLNVGTEMNSYGNKLMDDFDAPELAPVASAFLDGAYFIYGHTALQRKCGLGYQSAWAQAALPTRRERNAFYTAAGRRLPPGRAGSDALRDAGPHMTPADLLALL